MMKALYRVNQYFSFVFHEISYYYMKKAFNLKLLNSHFAIIAHFRKMKKKNFN